MLLAQEPQLLLVDEPVAGMTDAETEQTAELLREINRTRSVVVVEHDMAFVRALGCEGDGAARRVGAVGRLDRPCQRGSASHRSVSGAIDAERGKRRSALRRRHRVAPGVADGGGRRGDLPARPQRRGQDQPAAGDHRRASDQLRGDQMGRRGHHAPADPRTGAARHRLGAAGPRHVSAADGAGKSGDRIRRAAARRSAGCRTRCSSCFRC